MGLREITNLDNNPPSPVEVLQARLRADHDPILNEATELKNKTDKLLTKPITDDAVSGLYSNLAKEISASIKKLDTVRVGENEPYLMGQRTVNGLFNLEIENLETHKGKINSSLTSYLNEKERLKRIELEAQAAAAKKESEEKLKAATQLAEIGLNDKVEETLVKAQTASDNASRLGGLAMARPADLSRTRGSSSVASLRSKMVGKIDDVTKLDLEKLRPYLSVADLQKAVNAYVKAGHTELAGASIYSEASASVR